MRLVKHDSGHCPCNGPAFYCKDDKFGAFDRIPSSNVDDLETLDGEKPPVGEPLACGTCGETWSMYEEAVIVPGED